MYSCAVAYAPWGPWASNTGPVIQSPPPSRLPTPSKHQDFDYDQVSLEIDSDILNDMGDRLTMPAAEFFNAVYEVGGHRWWLDVGGTLRLAPE